MQQLNTNMKRSRNDKNQRLPFSFVCVLLTEPKCKVIVCFKFCQFSSYWLNSLNLALYYVISTCNNVFIDENVKFHNIFLLPSF